MTFITGWAWYFWNWFWYMQDIGKMNSCWQIGGWGTFFDNDNGYEMNACQLFMGPTTMKFPLRYNSIFEDPKNEDPKPDETDNGN